VATADIAALLDLLMRLLALINTNCRCTEEQPDCEPTQSSLVAGVEGGLFTEDGGIVTLPTSAMGAGNELVAILSGLATTILLLAILLTVLYFWRRRRCINVLGQHCCIVFLPLSKLV